MFLSLSYRRICQTASRPKLDKYARRVQKEILELEKLYSICSGLSSTPKRRICGSSLSLVDETTNSTSNSHDTKQDYNGKEERKKSLSLPTVYLPAELQTALDKAMSSKSFFYRYSKCMKSMINVCACT